MPPNRKMAHGRPCPYCGRNMERFHPKLEPTRDHVVPQSAGGRWTIICCIQCNGIKADMLPEVWIAFMQANPNWWLMTKGTLRVKRKVMFETATRKVAMDQILAHRQRRQKQGTPPAKPVVVPPGLIWSKTARPPWNNPELIAQTVEDDARMRAAVSTDDQPSLSDEACPR